MPNIHEVTKGIVGPSRLALPHQTFLPREETVRIQEIDYTSFLEVGLNAGIQFDQYSPDEQPFFQAIDRLTRDYNFNLSSILVDYPIRNPLQFSSAVLYEMHVQGIFAEYRGRGYIQEDGTVDRKAKDRIMQSFQIIAESPMLSCTTDKNIAEAYKNRVW